MPPQDACPQAYRGVILLPHATEKIISLSHYPPLHPSVSPLHAIKRLTRCPSVEPFYSSPPPSPRPSPSRNLRRPIPNLPPRPRLPSRSSQSGQTTPAPIGPTPSICRIDSLQRTSTSEISCAAR